MRRVLMVVLLVLVAPAFCAAATVSPEPFFRHPDNQGLRLSPSGKYVAALVPVQGRVRIAVIDLEAKSAKVVAGFDEQDVTDVRWVNDRRLVFSLIDEKSGLGEQRGGGLFAVDRDGAEFRELAPTIGKAENMLSRYRPVWLLATLRDGSDDVLVETNSFAEQYSDVYRLDTRTAHRTLKSIDRPGNVVHWVADRAGAVRAAETYDRNTGRSGFYWRPSEDAKWVEVGDYGTRGERMSPVTFDGDGSLIVYADFGRDTAALYRFDADKRAPGELLAAHPTHDLADGLVYDEARKRIVGLFYDAERPGYAWFDDDWARLAQGVDRALPGRMNRIARAGARALVYSYSDTDPGTYYLLDIPSGRMEFVASVRKDIDPARMPHREARRYAARDGLSVPAYVTLPPDGKRKALPLVVVVHGGPWVRGSDWGWDAEAAYLASLGYAVLQPEYRGSTGWGRKAYEASFRQWGRSMQDDLDDGVDWLVQQGIADPARVCIMGGSYGGYAVMLGLARNPERWKCGVDIVGVTEITYMFDVTWSDTWNSDWLKSNGKELIGDPDKDAELLRAASPLRNAARIRAPVLMAYGGQDRRVPAVHGERMRDTLVKQGVPVEWVLYPDEGHGFMVEATRFDLYSRVARFLDAHIGAEAAQHAAAPR